ncbi:PorV/PorQ family protein [bacterium]|nr:PorV/PorQ family protein [bacterium]
MKKNLLSIFCSSMICSSLAFGQSNTGTTAVQFLKIDPSPRAVGMGGAFSAISDDASAPYWNVAGLASFKNSQFQLTKINYLVGTNLVYFSGAIPIGDKGVLGASVQTFDSGEMEITTYQEQDGTGETFKVTDSAIGINYAYAVTDKFHFGTTVKYVRSKISSTTAQGLALDFGGKFTTDVLNLRMGFVINNFGSKMKLEGNGLIRAYDEYSNSTGNDEFVPVLLKTDEFDLPLMFRFGIAIDPIKTELNRLTLSTDALHPNDQSESINVGAEYGFREIFFARIGYTSLFEKNTEKGLTFGFGVKYKIGQNLKFALDYAYKDFGRLSNNTLWNVSLIF